MAVERIPGFIYRNSFDVTGLGLNELALERMLYFNLHTEDFPGGEIRGEIETFDGITLQATLSGAQEIPASSSIATGTAEIGVAADNTGLWDIEVRVFGITTDQATGFHIHEGQAGTNGGVVLNLDPDGALRSDAAPDLRAAGFIDAAQYQGTDGADRIKGSEITDEILGSGGRDYLNGLRGDDDIDAGRGRDTLLGGNGSDTLSGDTGNDILRGGNGNDMIVGGRGRDRIETGNGRDQIVYDSSDIYSGSDTISDFDPARDQFVLRQFESAAPRFAKVSPDDADARLGAGKDVVVITGDNGMTTRQAIAYVADLNDDVDNLLVAFYHSNSGTARLLNVQDPNFGTAKPNGVLASFGDSPDILDDLQRKTFFFGAYDDFDF